MNAICPRCGLVQRTAAQQIGGKIIFGLASTAFGARAVKNPLIAALCVVVGPGGESGCAAIVHFPEDLRLLDDQIVDFGCSESSMNRMELMACVKAIDCVRDNAPWLDVTRVLIVTDSQYVTHNIFRAGLEEKRLAQRPLRMEVQLRPMG